MFGIQFYPTPEKLADYIVSKVEFKDKMCILEPSAGKGDLVEAVKRKMKEIHMKCHMDCIEISDELSAILKSKHINVIGKDFLKYNGYTKYDLIIMNPPFSDGDKHLLKAIEVMRRGGQIVCILNAETIKNPFSNIRNDLINKLTLYNADIEFMESAFLDAEVKTNVEIAIVYINIPPVEERDILKNLQKDISILQKEDDIEMDNESYLAENDIFEALVKQYRLECELGLKLIEDFRTLQKYIPSGSFKTMNPYENVDLKLIQLSVTSTYEPDEVFSLENRYVRELRYKYWKALFRAEKMSSLFTQEMRDVYNGKLHEMRNYDFTKSNILQVQLDLSMDMSQSMDDAIIKMFDKLTHEYSMDRAGNIHYYNGWKTNKAYIIKNKIIQPFYNLRSIYGWEIAPYSSFVSFFEELEKVFTYLDGGKTEGKTVREISIDLGNSKNRYDGGDIECKYFRLCPKKKGTVHVYFKDLNLLKKFNVFAGRKKGWLPESYGKKQYKQMTEEEKDVIDSFEGEDSYNETLINSQYYLSENNMKLLNG